MPLKLGDLHFVIHRATRYSSGLGIWSFGRERVQLCVIFNPLKSLASDHLHGNISLHVVLLSELKTYDLSYRKDTVKVLGRLLVPAHYLRSGRADVRQTPPITVAAIMNIAVGDVAFHVSST